MSSTSARRLSLASWLGNLVVYAGLLALAISYGYWTIFGEFAAYDDEGFFDYTLKLFLQGHPLYTTIWTTYGPFYYEVFGAVFKVFGTTPTTDSGRMVTLVMWVLTSLLLAAVAHRLTRRLVVGAATFASSFYLLRVLTNEPMHTQGIICVLLALLAAVTVFALPRWRRTSLLAIGAICGALLLSKINVGGYAVVSVLFAAAVTGQAIFRRRLLAWLMALIFTLIGPLVMISALSSSSTQSYALIVVGSTLAIVFVAVPVEFDRGQPDGAWSWIGWMVAGAIGLAVVVIAVLLALGTSFGDFFQMIVIEPTKQANFLTVPAVIEDNAIIWTVAAAALAWMFRAAGWTTAPPQGPRARACSAVARLFVGIAIILSLSEIFPFSIGPNAPFTLAMPLAFVAAIPPFARSENSYQRFARVLIPHWQSCSACWPTRSPAPRPISGASCCSRAQA